MSLKEQVGRFLIRLPHLNLAYRACLESSSHGSWLGFPITDAQKLIAPSFLDFLGSGAWICQLGAWNCQLGVWICLLGAWISLLGAWICLLGAWVFTSFFGLRRGRASGRLDDGSQIPPGKIGKPLCSEQSTGSLGGDASRCV